MDGAYTTPLGDWIGDTLPSRINVTKVITYTVADIVSNILEERQSSQWVNSAGQKGGESRDLEITLGEVLERIEEYTKDDFSCGWGHEADTDDLIFTDENGEELP